jgi:hypothetical protein
MTDFLITAPAGMSSTDFLDLIAPLFGKPTKADKRKQAELAAALAEHQDAIQRTYAIPRLWDQITAREALKVEFEMRVREIEQRYVPYTPFRFKTLDDGREQVAA